MKKIAIASLITKWHLYGFESFLYTYLKDIDEVLVFVQPFRNIGEYRISKKDFCYINMIKKITKIIYVDKSFEQIRLIKEVVKRNRDAEFFMFCSRVINIWHFGGVYYARNKKFIILDEGIGDYFNKEMWIIENKYTNQKYKRESLIRRSLRVIVKKMVENRTKEYKILKKQDEVWYPNEKVITVLKSYFKLRKDKRLNYKRDIRDAVFISNNLSYMLVPNADIAMIYRKIYNIIRMSIKTDGIIWYKPHPNERNELILDVIKSSGFAILDTKESAEDLVCASSDSVSIYGFCSTALVSIAVLFENSVYCMNGILHNDILNEYGRSKIEIFNKLIQNVRIINVLNGEYDS